jgi:hypothetical protein
MKPDLFTAMGFDPLPPIPHIHAKGYTPSEQDTKRIARSASAMNAKVLALFLDNPNTGYIAPEVHAIVGGLLTSVRRTLTDLMNDEFLVKTGTAGRARLGWRIVSIN